MFGSWSTIVAPIATNTTVPGRRRYRQQLYRFSDPARCHFVGQFAHGRDQHQSRRRGRLPCRPEDSGGFGDNLETAVIATVGTAGATTVRTTTGVGATVLPAANVTGFTKGQTIMIDSGANLPGVP